MFEVIVVILLSIGALIFAAVGMGYIAHNSSNKAKQRCEGPYHYQTKLYAEFEDIMRRISGSKGNNGKKEKPAEPYSVKKSDANGHIEPKNNGNLSHLNSSRYNELLELQPLEREPTFLDKIKKYFRL